MRRDELPPGPMSFALAVLHALRDEAVQCPGRADPLRVHVDRLERGGNPFREEFRVRFRLTDAPPLWAPEAVEVSDSPVGVTGSMDTRGLPGGAPVGGDVYYFFRFRKAWGLEPGMDRFREFVRARLNNQR